MPNRSISISAKCADAFFATLIVDGKRVGEYNGYVPLFLQNNWGGEDYIEWQIDVDTGKILNWKRPTVKDLKIFKKES